MYSDFKATRLRKGLQWLTLVSAGLWTFAGSADDILIDWRSLHIDCVGEGSPTIVFDSGLGGSSLEWVYVKEHLEPLTRVCTFDRAGYGASDAGAIPRSSSRIANELFLLLENAGAHGPYVLVGHSFGGLNAALFARRYRYLTAALVLVDASHPDQVERFLAPPLNMLTAPSSRYGVVQYRDPPPAHPALPEAIKREISRRAAMRRTRRTLGNELLSFRDSAQQVRQSPDLADLPLLVITRGKVEGDLSEKRLLLEELWLQLQIELASASSASTHLRAQKSGHHVHIEQPDVVAFGIQLLLERLRKTQQSGAPRADSISARIGTGDVAWISDTLKLHP